MAKASSSSSLQFEMCSAGKLENLFLHRKNKNKFVIVLYHNNTYDFIYLIFKYNKFVFYIGKQSSQRKANFYVSDIPILGVHRNKWPSWEQWFDKFLLLCTL